MNLSKCIRRNRATAILLGSHYVTMVIANVCWTISFLQATQSAHLYGTSARALVMVTTYSASWAPSAHSLTPHPTISCSPTKASSQSTFVTSEKSLLSLAAGLGLWVEEAGSVASTALRNRRFSRVLVPLCARIY